MTEIAQWFENQEYQLRLVQETQGRQQRELDELNKWVRTEVAHLWHKVQILDEQPRVTVNHTGQVFPTMRDWGRLKFEEREVMVNVLQRLSELSGNMAGAMDPNHYPRRGDIVELWIKMWRDSLLTKEEGYSVLDQMLDKYRELADTGESLNEDFEDHGESD